MSDNDSQPMDIDSDSPLTREERTHLRRLLRDDDRATWARKQLRIFVPMGVAVLVFLWQAWIWIRDHVRVSP